jgi:hypothetical protein
MSESLDGEVARAGSSHWQNSKNAKSKFMKLGKRNSQKAKEIVPEKIICGGSRVHFESWAEPVSMTRWWVRRLQAHHQSGR